MHTRIYSPQVAGIFLRNILPPHLHVDSHARSRAERVLMYVADPSGNLRYFCLTRLRSSLVTIDVAYSVSSVNYKLKVYPCLRVTAWLVACNYTGHRPLFVVYLIHTAFR
jgi:hypothetical protein